MKAKNVSAGVTAFIDILGFGKKVEVAEELHDIQAIEKLVKTIQDQFDFKTKSDLTKKVHKIYDKTVLAFSDSVIVNIPLQSKATKYEGTFDPLMSELSGFAYAQGACVLEGLFLRGGVDVGWWYRSGNTLISGSMVGAYKTETKAVVPVIALTPKLYEQLADHDHRNFYSKDADPIKRSFRKYVSPPGREKVEFWFIDYISICVESVDWQTSQKQMNDYRIASPDEKDKIVSDGYRHNIDFWLSTHARKIEAAHSGATDDCVRYKYSWLSEYHNDVARNYTTNTASLCSVV